MSSRPFGIKKNTRNTETEAEAQNEADRAQNNQKG